MTGTHGSKVDVLWLVVEAMFENWVDQLKKKNGKYQTHKETTYLDGYEVWMMWNSFDARLMKTFLFLPCFKSR